MNEKKPEMRKISEALHSSRTVDVSGPDPQKLYEALQTGSTMKDISGRELRELPDNLVPKRFIQTSLISDYEISVGGTTLEEVVGEGIGAASSMRFWDKMPELYPYGAGTFLDQNARALVEVIVKRLKEILPLYHDDQTLGKVYDALRRVGLSDALIIGAVHDMQNQGVFFREVGRG